MPSRKCDLDCKNPARSHLHGASSNPGHDTSYLRASVEYIIFTPIAGCKSHDKSSALGITEGRQNAHFVSDSHIQSLSCTSIEIKTYKLEFLKLSSARQTQSE